MGSGTVGVGVDPPVLVRPAVVLVEVRARQLAQLVHREASGRPHSLEERRAERRDASVVQVQLRAEDGVLTRRGGVAKLIHRP